MTKKRILTDLIQIDNTLNIPVYKQIVQSIHRNIENSILKKDDKLPSVNQIAGEFSLARGSVFSAYNELRSSGIIDSTPGKGYYVVKTDTTTNKKIFLLFSTFTPYKETLFNALRDSLPKNCSIDIYFHYHSIKVFETLITEQAAYYNTYIIMPEVNEKTPAILSKLDAKQTFLLDVGLKEYRKDYAGVYQNFEKDIFNRLAESEIALSKYKRLFLIFPKTLRTTGIIMGFKKFAKKEVIYTEVSSSVPENVQQYDAFIVIDDNHLVDIVKYAKAKSWKLGKDIGLISYNETNLKSIIANGITTITTDFTAMGKTMSEMILSGKRAVVENPFVMIDRESF